MQESEGISGKIKKINDLDIYLDQRIFENNKFERESREESDERNAREQRLNATEATMLLLVLATSSALGWLKT